MFDFRRYTRFLPRLILSLQDLWQNQSPETVLVCIVVLCFPHSNIVCGHSCDEWKRSNEPSVCHKFLPIWWQLVQVCLRTTDCQVHQFWPNTSIAKRFESKLWTIFRPFPVLPSWTDGRQGTEERHQKGSWIDEFANSHNRSAHFFAWPSMSQDQTTVSACDFSRPDNVSVAPAEIRGSNLFLASSTLLSIDLHSRWVHPKCTWSRNDVGFPRQTSFIHFFHMGTTFCFLPAMFCRPRLSTRMDLIFDERTCIPNSVLFPIQVPTELLQMVLPTTIRQVCDQTDFVQEEPHRFGPLVSWKTYSNIWAFWLGNFE